MLIIVAGTIAQSGTGGQAWATMQHLLGLESLGHEVVYLEDVGEWGSVYDWTRGELTTDMAYPAHYLRDTLAPMGFRGSWIYRAGDDSAGMSMDAFRECCARADLLVMRAAPLSLWRPEYAWPRRRAFIDVDPGFTQMRMLSGNDQLSNGILRCDTHFTVGINVGRPECLVPTAGIEWISMLPPVSLAHWPACEGQPGACFTTIMRWRGFHDVQHEGVNYGQKDKAFPEYLSLPQRTTQRFRVALLGTDAAALERAGWDIVSGYEATRTPRDYHQFIAESRAEFGVPKHTYAATRSGWISDRSVCYLASARPVLVGDTALPEAFMTGRGLVTFDDLDSAVVGVEALNADYDAHCRAARALAEEHFAADRVMQNFLQRAVG